MRLRFAVFVTIARLLLELVVGRVWHADRVMPFATTKEILFSVKRRAFLCVSSCPFP